MHSRACRFTGLAEAELESSPKADRAAVAKDDGAGVESVDGGESACCVVLVRTGFGSDGHG